MTAFLITVVCVPLCAYFLPGVHAISIEYAFIAGLALAFIYLLVRPMLRLITKPLGCITFGLIGTMIDSALILFLSNHMPGLTIYNYQNALIMALIINLARSIFGQKVVDDD